MNSSRIRVQNFGWRHGSRRDPSIHSLSFDIEPGEKVLLAGPSGAGKSTLLLGIAGLLGAAQSEEGESEGRILIGDKEAHQVQGKVGLLLQDPDSQIIASTIADDVAFGCENMGVLPSEIPARIRWALELVGLDLPLDHPTHHLSGGQKQRLALAGVVAMGAEVILLDEPTANIDPTHTEQVINSIGRVAEETGATIILVEHKLAPWMRMIDKIIALDSTGTLSAIGETQEVLRRYGDQLQHEGIWLPDVPIFPSGTSNTLGDPLEKSISSSREKEIHRAHLHWEKLGIGWGSQPIRTGLTGSLDPGSTCLMGENGAGKTTFSMTLAGLIPPIEGEIVSSVEGESRRSRRRRWFMKERGSRSEKRKRKPLTTSPYEWQASFLIQQIGYVFQNPDHQFFSQTVYEELLLGARCTNMDPTESEQRAEELLSQVGLSHLKKAHPHTLSGGEKRRLSVISAVMTKPPLLILDEPTFGQDYQSFMSLIHILQTTLESGSSVLAITHDEDYRRLMGEKEIWL